jgi:hypothetical protein
MSSSVGDTHDAPWVRAGEISFAPAEYGLFTSDNKSDPEQPEWKVTVSPHENMIKRQVFHQKKLWKDCQMDWEPEEIIWPTWPGTAEAERALAASPLAGLHDEWSRAGNRLRDSAKWMATVLGAALAALIGASPLGEFKDHKLHGWAIVLGAAGLILLGITLFFVLQVMRPRTVSYEEVQNPSRRSWNLLLNPLYQWKQAVEGQRDLYLPRGVRSLNGLRDAMVIEEVTLMALARAKAKVSNHETFRSLCAAETVRAAWLMELRNSAAKIVAVGEYYKLRERSTLATYGGVMCGLLGTMAIVATFALPLS